jgi:serine/threonine protein kinase
VPLIAPWLRPRILSHLYVWTYTIYRYEGFLYKEGRQIKKWNKRFFVLWPKEEHPQMGRILAYFEQNTQTNLFQVKGVIHIVKPVVRAPKTRRPEKYCMRLNANAIVGTASDVPAVNHLITENDKKYIIGTDEQHRMETWVQQLRQCGNANGGVLPNPVEEGWLLIQESGMMRWWKKSWVQLHENAAGDPTLVHYDSSVTWPKGTFNLNHYFIYFPKPTESLREYEIALLPRPPQTRTASEAELREKTAHYFCAEDEKQFQKWRAKLSQKGDEITHEVGELRYRECRQQRSADASSNYSPPVQVLSHRRPTARTGGVGGAGRRSQNAGVAHLHDFDILNMLGEGAFGKVLLVRHRGEKKQYAMKMMMKDAIVKGNKEAEVTKELETMISIEHPFIVQVHYAFHNQDRLFLVVDFMPGGELYHHLKKVGSFSEKQACFICAEISLALGYLHDEKDMAYRDLKPENVMFTSEGHIRLIDFGLAKWEVSMAVRSTACGTPLYMTPEGVENFHALHAQSSSNGVRVGKEADWYALGTLMYELTVGEAPFQADEQHVLLDKIRTKPVSFSGAAAALSADAKDIMMRLMTKDPSKRLGHRGQAELQGHDFFSEMDWEALEQHSAKPLYIPPSQSKENFPSAQLRKDAQRIAGMDDASSPEDERFAMWQFPRPMPAGDRTPLAEETTGSIAEEPELDEEPEPEPEPQLEPEPEPEPEPLPLEPASPAVTTQPPDAGAVSTATRDDDTPTPVIRSSWIQQHGPEEENLATDAGPAGDLEFEFVEDRIGIVLIGVDEFGEDAEDDDTPCLFIEVEDIAEGSPAAQHPQIQPGMALKSIGGKSVLGLSFNATIDVLASAERPMKIVLGPPPPTKPAKPEPELEQQPQPAVPLPAGGAGAAVGGDGEEWRCLVSSITKNPSIREFLGIADDLVLTASSPHQGARCVKTTATRAILLPSFRDMQVFCVAC